VTRSTDSPPSADLELRCDVDGVTVQKARTSDLLFPPAAVVAYVARFTTLRPGDLIATGTPGGVGAGRDPKVFLRPGQLLETTLERVGSCRNLMVADPGTGDPEMPDPGMAGTA
jgi:acylpyruvate hydrolase